MNGIPNLRNNARDISRRSTARLWHVFDARIRPLLFCGVRETCRGRQLYTNALWEFHIFGKTSLPEYRVLRLLRPRNTPFSSRAYFNLENKGNWLFSCLSLWNVHRELVIAFSEFFGRNCVLKFPNMWWKLCAISFRRTGPRIVGRQRFQLISPKFHDVVE